MSVKKILLSLSISILITTLLIIYVIYQKEYFLNILNYNFKYLLFLLILNIISNITSAFSSKIIINEFGIEIRIINWLGIPVVSNLISMIVPIRLDFIFTAIMYKNIGLAYHKFSSIIAGSFLISYAFSTIIIFISMLYCLIFQKLFLFYIWLFAVICLLLLIVFIYLIFNKKELLLNIIPFKKYTLTIVEKITDGLIFLLSNKILLVKITILLLINTLIKIFKFVLIFKMIGISVDFFKAMIYTSVTWFSEQISITPGNIGIKEAIIGALSVYTNNLFNNGVLISILLRIIDFSSYFLLFLIFGFPVFYMYFKIKQKRIDKI